MKCRSQYHCHGSLSLLHKLQDLQGLSLSKRRSLYIEEAKSLVPDAFLLTAPPCHGWIVTFYCVTEAASQDWGRVYPRHKYVKHLVGTFLVPRMTVLSALSFHVSFSCAYTTILQKARYTKVLAPR